MGKNYNGRIYKVITFKHISSIHFAFDKRKTETNQRLQISLFNCLLDKVDIGSDDWLGRSRVTMSFKSDRTLCQVFCARVYRNNPLSIAMEFLIEESRENE
ncbi:hypothetical protein YC2023_019686 [Brassica napus]